MAITKNISLDYQDVIVIGRRGENEAVDIVWDISPLVAEFGGGTALVLAKRATDESAYPVTLTEQTDTTLTWTVSSVDSCVIGVGKVQLFWYVGNVLAKSFMWRTFCGDDITGMVGDPPEAYESWLEHLAEMGADILNDAKAEVENAEAWAVGERGGEPVVDGDETYHNNAKYWSGVSSDYASSAESSADAAEQSAGDAAHQVELAEAQVTLAEAQVALAEQKVQDAAAQVALAEAQANAAAGSASDASGYALAASGYASDANAFSGQAYTSAQNAAQSASDAAGYASDALDYKNAASDSATLAGNKANDASGYADNASTYANNASGYADAASASADAAAASATEAAGYVASLVNGKAGVLEDSASGDVVSIVPDKSVGKLYKAAVSLSPIQSLNGYDHPWAGGAGKNLFQVAASSTSASDVTVTINADGTVNLSGTASADVNVILGNFVVEIGKSYLLNGCTFSTNACRLQFQLGSTTKVNQYGTTDALIEQDAGTYRLRLHINSGTNVNGVVIKPMIRLASVTDATFSPYENICPISGHTGATLNVTGKNLYSREYSRYNVPVYGQYGSISSFPDVAAFWIKVKPNTTYYVSHNQPTTTFYFRWINCDANKGFISRPGGTYSNDAIPSSFITPANTEWVEIAVNQHQASQIASNNWEVCISETPTDYVPFGSQYTATFGQTVYGGTFDFVSGKLVVEWANVTFDGTETWSASGNNAYIALNSLVKIKNATYIGSIYCDKLVTVYNNGNIGGLSTDFSITGYNDFNELYTGQNWIYIHLDSTQSSAEDFKAWVAANPIQVVYKLATPVEIDLDPTEVETLIGTNNVWSDGEMSVDYAADLKTYIDNKIAAAVAALS